MDKNGLWSFQLDTCAERWQCEQTFNTKEEAIKAGRKDAKKFALENFDTEEEASEWLENGKFEIGCLKSPTFSVNADDILENIQEQVDEQCGEIAEGWLDFTTSALELDLEERINKLIEGWLDEIGQKPTFYYIDDIEEVKVLEVTNETK